MMKRKLVFISLALTICFIIILIFSYFHRNPRENGFKRNIAHFKLKSQYTFELPDRSFGFLNSVGYKVALIRFTSNRFVYYLNFSPLRLDSVEIKFDTKFDSKANPVFKDVSDKSVFSGNLHGDLAITEGKESYYYKYTNVSCDFFRVISNRSLIARAFTNYENIRSFSLVKINLLTNSAIKAEFRFPKSPDGLFSNDGMLVYDGNSKSVFYMYYYKGEFLSLDTNLNVHYTAKTIDTVKVGHTRTGIIRTKKQNSSSFIKGFTQNSPPKIVNAFMAVDNGLCYIISRLKSDNEIVDEHLTQQIIDVYKVNDGTYVNSFYIPKYNKQKLDQIVVNDNHIIGLYGASVVWYSFER